MELFQLRYLVETIRRKGIVPAANALHVSAPAISRAISSLEGEVSCKLFDRVGRSLQLNANGKAFLLRAEEILRLADLSLDELRGTATVAELVIAGREVFLGKFGLEIARHLRKEHPNVVIRMIATTGDKALELLRRGEAHISLVVQFPPKEWRVVKMADLELVTCVGATHPLAKRNKPIHIDEVLKHGFVSPASPIFGRIKKSGAPDGWRDDVHPRRISFVTESLEVFAQIIARGEAVAYIPDYWASAQKFTRLSVRGCGFQASLNVYACSRLHAEYAWLNSLMDSLG